MTQWRKRSVELMVVVPEQREILILGSYIYCLTLPEVGEGSEKVWLLCPWRFCPKFPLVHHQPSQADRPKWAEVIEEKLELLFGE